MKRQFSMLLSLALVVALVSLISIPSFAQTIPNWRLRYSHVANGVFEAMSYQTAALVHNPNNVQVEVQLEDWSHDNSSNAMRTSWSTDCLITSNGPSTFRFLILAYSTCKLTTDATVALETGWVRFTEYTNSKNLGGYLAWTLYQGTGTSGSAIFSVGVSPMEISQQFSIPIVRDAVNGDDTGYSLVNPYTSSIAMRAFLYDMNGNQVTYADIAMAPASHRAQFFSEIFSPYLANARNFVGAVVFVGNTTSDAAIASALIQTRGQYGGASATLINIRGSKSPRDGGLEEATGPAHSALNRNKGVQEEAARDERQ